MKRDYVVLLLTTHLSPGALETRLGVEKESDERKENLCAPAHLSDSDKVTYLEFLFLKSEQVIPATQLQLISRTHVPFISPSSTFPTSTHLPPAIQSIIIGDQKTAA